MAKMTTVSVWRTSLRRYVTGVVGIALVLILLVNIEPSGVSWTRGSYRNLPTVSPQPVPVTSLDGVRTSLLKPDENYVVPNVVHYVWFGEWVPFAFHHALSLLSAENFIKPDRIMFHCDHQPVGHWWKYVKKKLKTLNIVARTPVNSIHGRKVLHVEHKSDIARLDILQQYGGIYLDTDVIALRSFDPLRKYNFTMGIEYHGRPGRLNNGIILANRSSPFLQIWRETYKNFSKTEWDYHDCIIPYNLQFLYPDLIHVEEKKLNYPSGKQLELIYEERFDWSQNYAIHLWHRLHGFDHNAHDIKAMNTTFGEIARLVFYGSSKIKS